MKLDLPYFQQERSTTCGIAALRMVFGYFKGEFTEKELLQDVKLHSFGTFATDLGVIALNKGFNVTCYTFHLGLLGSFNLDYGTKIDEKVLESIKVSSRDKMVLECWKNYIKYGGQLIWDVPKLEQLGDSLKIQVPCIVSVNTAALKRFWGNWDNGHILVVNGIGEDNVNILDPDPEGFGKQYKLVKDILLSSWIINAVKSSNDLLVIKRI